MPRTPRANTDGDARVADSVLQKLAEIAKEFKPFRAIREHRRAPGALSMKR
jgi:hypothetical protein